MCGTYNNHGFDAWVEVTDDCGNIYQVGNDDSDNYNGGVCGNGHGLDSKLIITVLLLLQVFMLETGTLILHFMFLIRMSGSIQMDCFSKQKHLKL